MTFISIEKGDKVNRNTTVTTRFYMELGLSKTKIRQRGFYLTQSNCYTTQV